MSDPARQKLLHLIDDRQEAAIVFLQQMIAIPSVTGDEAASRNSWRDYMTEHRPRGRHVGNRLGGAEEAPRLPPGRSRLRGTPNIVATMKGTGGGRSLLLNGHTDVIPVNDGVGWSDDPWSARSRTAASMGAAPAT